MLDKIFSLNIEFDDKKILKVYKILGITIKTVISKRELLLNKNLCNKIGIKTILLIRSDGIGDFIFDRSYIKYIKQSEKYKDYTIIFAGSPQNVEIAKRYDSKYISEFITMGKQYHEVKKIAKKISFNVVVNPTDAKTNASTEKFIKKIKADEKICQSGYFCFLEKQRIPRTVKKVLSNYTKNITTTEELMFVRDIQHKFFEKLLDMKLPKTERFAETDSEIDLRTSYFIVSPFSKAKRRTYSGIHYAKIIDFLTKELKKQVLIIGNENEAVAAEAIKYLCEEKALVKNLAGKISMPEVFLYIKYADLLVANETGTVHVAQNYGTKTVCISNGSYWNTFQPYPKEESMITYVYPDDIEKYINESPLKGDVSEVDINIIKPEKVIDTIKQVLSYDIYKIC